MSSKTRHEYASRVNRVIDYIEMHLDESLDLETLARVAYFSPFHFHRLFKAYTGETLNLFINRIRVERAAVKLSFSTRGTITETAYECGFSSSAAFARSFKSYFGMSASEWISRCGSLEKRKIGKTDRNDWEDSTLNIRYHARTKTNQHYWSIDMNENEIKVKIEQYPDIPVAYIRNVGPYKGDTALFENLFEKLCRWAGPKGLIMPESRFFAVYHDDPEVTNEEKLRMSICLQVPSDTKVANEVGKMTLSGGLYAVAHFCIKDPIEYENCWQAIYRNWLPESGYQPEDGPPFEEYLNDPQSDPEGRHMFNICIPVKPL